MSIKCRFCANPSANIPSPPKHIFANHFQSWTIHANPGQSYANPGYSEDKCASNLLNKLLYGLLVGLLGGWIGPSWHHNLYQPTAKPLSGLAQHWHRYLQSWTIQCQFQAISEDVCLDNQGTSLLYGMVPSLLGGRNLRHSIRSAPIQGQSLAQSRINLIHFFAI